MAETERKSNGTKRFLKFVTVLIVIALLFVIYLRGCRAAVTVKQGATTEQGIPETDTAELLDTTAQTDIDSGAPAGDTIAAAADTVDTIKSRIVHPHRDAVVKKKAEKDSLTVEKTVDTTHADTVAVSMVDTAVVPEDSCSRDTTELWVYPDPSGGLHQRVVQVVFVANRPAKIQYRTSKDSVWHVYDGNAVKIDTTTTLYYDAIDSCGRIMDRRTEYYEIEKGTDASQCDQSMALVKIGSVRFCIDRYEWPNRKGARPQAFISYYQAGDSCYSAGKRLCTSEEWAMACSGPYSWKYPYGQKYERYGCSTHDTTTVPSGSKPECRSFFGVFDMSGNLLEWTSTRSVENSTFYYVMGGFWESGPKSGCFDKRYSYYPQNRHNPVGFRCCRDIAGGKESGGR